MLLAHGTDVSSRLNGTAKWQDASYTAGNGAQANSKVLLPEADSHPQPFAHRRCAASSPAESAFAAPFC
jgi:hypothetical protein